MSVHSVIIVFLIDRKRPQVSKNSITAVLNLLFAMRRLSMRDAARHVATKTVHAGSVESFAKCRII